MRLLPALMLLVLLGPSAALAATPRRSYVTFEDPRLIGGQRARVDSLYVIDREELDMKSLVSRARTFRNRIVRSIFEE